MLLCRALREKDERSVMGGRGFVGLEVVTGGCGVRIDTVERNAFSSAVAPDSCE